MGRSSFRLVPFSQLTEDTPDVPGIYVWLIRPENHKQSLSAIRFFTQTSLEAEVRGNLRFRFKGKLTKDIEVTSLSNSTNGIIDDILPNLFFAVGYPLYVGISNSLSTRLSKHQAQFTAARRSKSPQKLAWQEELNIGEDSDEESKYFGGRLASMWQDGLTDDNLYVKLVTASVCGEERSCSSCGKGCRDVVRNSLQECETLANSIFNPVFGRR